MSGSRPVANWAKMTKVEILFYNNYSKVHIFQTEQKWFKTHGKLSLESGWHYGNMSYIEQLKTV